MIAYGDYNDDGISDLAFLAAVRNPRRPGEGFGLFCPTRPGRHGQADAIDLYAFESGGVLYVWDAASARFRRIAVAD